MLLSLEEPESSCAKPLCSTEENKTETEGSMAKSAFNQTSSVRRELCCQAAGLHSKMEGSVSRIFMRRSARSDARDVDIG